MERQIFKQKDGFQMPSLLLKELGLSEVSTNVSSQEVVVSYDWFDQEIKSILSERSKMKANLQKRTYQFQIQMQDKIQEQNQMDQSLEEQNKMDQSLEEQNQMNQSLEEQNQMFQSLEEQNQMGQSLEEQNQMGQRLKDEIIFQVFANNEEELFVIEKMETEYEFTFHDNNQCSGASENYPLNYF